LLTDDYQIIDSISNNAEDRKSNIGATELANLQIVLKELREKKYQSAFERLDFIEKNKNYNDVTRYFARYLLCSVIIDHEKDLKILDDKDNKNNDRVNSLDAKIDEYFNHFDSELKPFFASALTLKAIWLYKKDKLVEARQVLELIINSKASRMLKENAHYVLSNIETEIKKKQIQAKN